MAEKRAPKKWWRISLACLRGIRLAVLLIILLIVGSLAWLNTIGLPEFIKRPVVAQLHDLGVDLQFTRLRWRFYRGLVADNVRIGTSQTNSPELYVRQLSFAINHHELVRARLHVDSVQVSGGRFFWPLGETNEEPLSLAVTNIQTQLRFLPGNEWALDNFSAGFAGADLQLSGSFTNASAVRDWKIFHGKPGHPGQLETRLREIAKTIDQIHFEKTPVLDVNIRGDARNPNSFKGTLVLDAQGATTPWGTLSNTMLSVHLIPAANSNTLQTMKCSLKGGDLKFEVHPDSVRKVTGEMQNLHLEVEGALEEGSTNTVRAKMEITASHFKTPWIQATNAHLSANWTHSLTNAIPISGTGEVRLSNARTSKGSVGELHARASLKPAAKRSENVDASWAWWASIEPYELEWDCRVENLHAKDFRPSEVIIGGNWRAPVLTITNLHSAMFKGHLDASADLNVVTRATHFVFASDFDILKAVPLLPPKGKEWFDKQQLEWEQPPLIHGAGSLVLPEWTNTHPNWRNEVVPTLNIGGEFSVTNASFRNMSVNSCRSHIYYSNEVVSLPDLFAVRPEGKLDMAFVSDEKSQAYYFRFLSSVNAKVARHMAPESAQRGIDSIVLTTPPKIDCEVWGLWHDHARVGVKGQVEMTNFVARGAQATYFHAFFNYTNSFLELTDARLERTNEVLSASSLRFDILGKRAYVTNGFTSMEPMVVLRAIGPHVARDMEPYRFLKIPTIRANGVIPISDDTSVADLHFAIDGGPFEWLKFHVPHISAKIDWVDDKVNISDIKSTFYEGKLTGSTSLDFQRNKKGTRLKFDVIVTGVNFHLLMSDLSTPTNRLEGTLDGHLNISDADTEKPFSWFGKGSANLHDGFISDIPVFSILTPVLDSISPGLGKTRATDAKGTFIITNSIIRSDDLVIYSSLLRLFYSGTVDFNRKVDAVVTAEVGRDTPIFGRLFGTLSAPFGKLFETRITGNLEDPKHETVLPLFRWLNPFHWPQMLRELGGGESGDQNKGSPAK